MAVGRYPCNPQLRVERIGRVSGLIMKKSILEIYALAVCFVALVCFVIALGIGVYDLIQIANPVFTINAYEYDRHQSNEAFRRFPWAAWNGRLLGLRFRRGHWRSCYRTWNSHGTYDTSSRRRGHSTAGRELPSGTSVRAKARDAEFSTGRDYPGDRCAGVCASLVLGQENKRCKHGQLTHLFSPPTGAAVVDDLRHAQGLWSLLEEA